MTNENGIYSVVVGGPDLVTFTGGAPDNPTVDFVSGAYDGNGRLVGTFTLNGRFE